MLTTSKVQVFMGTTLLPQFASGAKAGSNFKYRSPSVFDNQIYRNVQVPNDLMKVNVFFFF